MILFSSTDLIVSYLKLASWPYRNTMMRTVITPGENELKVQIKRGNSQETHYAQ